MLAGAAPAPTPPAKPVVSNNSAAAVMQASLEKQRDSLKKQGDSLRHQPGITEDLVKAGADAIPPIPPLVQADCEPLPSDDVENLIVDAAQKHSLKPALIRAVMRQESAFRPCAVSIKGAQGLMQLMPATAGEFHVSDPFDPKQNVDAGAALLKQLLGKYKGDLRLALVAYNAGANRADNSDAQLYPAETQRYVASIFAELGLTTIQSLPLSPEIQDPDADKPAPPNNP